VRDENGGAMSEELAGDEDGEPVASPSERKRARGEAESLPLRTNTPTLYRVVLFLYDR
jgi:hypothetical protein